MLESAINPRTPRRIPDEGIGRDLIAFSAEGETGSEPGPKAAVRRPDRLLRGARRLRGAAGAALAASGRHGRCAAPRRLRIRCGRRRTRIAALLDYAQPRDVLEVLVVGLGECMPAGAGGDAEQLLVARRIGGGLDRRATGIGDRARRQTIDDVGVVRRRLRDIRLAERAAERALAEHTTVDDGRIRL